MSETEKEGGVPRCDRLIDAFRDVVNMCSLRDLGFKGSIFTWERGRTRQTYVRERLDQFLADVGWCSMFPETEVRNLPILNSDHAPIIASTIERRNNMWGGNAFKFKPLWLSNNECSGVVSKGWAEGVDLGITQKIALCGEKLGSWAALSFGSVRKNIKDKEKLLKELKEAGGGG
uniref:Uncharacterized protein n=1 Tax=Chenopodium quinoa TaxID=63459 RepID=A0A803NDI2_CHEQI